MDTGAFVTTETVVRYNAPPVPFILELDPVLDIPGSNPSSQSPPTLGGLLLRSDSTDADGTTVGWFWQLLQSTDTRGLTWIPDWAENNQTGVLQGVSVARYTVKLVAMDNDGSFGITNHTFEVGMVLEPKQIRPLIHAAGQPLSVRLGMGVRPWHPSYHLPALSYQWAVSSVPVTAAIPTLTNATSRNPLASALSVDGFYVFHCTVTSEFGVSRSAQLTVLVNQPPVPDIVPNSPAAILVGGDIVVGRNWIR